MIFSIENYEPYTGEYYLGEGVYIDLTEAEIDEMLNLELGEEVGYSVANQVATTSKKNRPRRDAKKLFVDGQKIHHYCGDDIWIGVYNSAKNSIHCNGTDYAGRSPLNEFVKTHYHVRYGSALRYKVNPWHDCKCEENGEWIPTWKLTE